MKPREKPKELKQLRATYRRLPPNHKEKERVLERINKRRAGLRGEREVDYTLRFLPKNNVLILHDLRLPDENGFFQIDTLLLTPNLIHILEIKNWSGTVLFGENGQVTRIYGEEEEGFPNPVLQTKLQRHRLYHWLRKNGISNIPIKFFVVISFPSTIIKSASPNYKIPKKVIHNSDLLFKIEELNEKIATPTVPMNRLFALSNMLQKAHTPPSTNIFERFDILEEDIIKGVFCPRCNFIPMIRDQKMWNCRKCNYYSERAHIPAFNDYSLLFNQYITNKQIRNFLLINSPYVAKRIVQKENFEWIGHNRYRKYKIKFNNKWKYGHRR